MQSPLHILSARLQSETPVCGVTLEPYILVRRADGTTVSAGETVSMYLVGFDDIADSAEYLQMPHCFIETKLIFFRNSK